MASFTLGKRVDIAKALLELFEQVTEVSDQMLRMYCQLSRDRVWKDDYGNRPHKYIKSTTLDDEDPLPNDYVLPTYDVYKSSVNYAYMEVASLGEKTTNPFVLANTTFPKWYICDQQFRTEPAGLTAVNFEYAWRPTQLFSTDPDAPIADSVEDGMPEDTEHRIIRGMVEMVLELVMSKEAAMEMMQLRAAEYAATNDRLMAEAFKSSNISPQNI